MKRPFSSAIATPELSLRLRLLADRLDAITAGDAPTAADLADAPYLHGWELAMAPTGPVLIGQVRGHPILTSRRIFTSPVWILEPEDRWALTLSRFYRLGPSVEEERRGGVVQ